MRLFILLISILLLSPVPLVAHEADSIKVVVVGDTGIGERAFHAGFDAVQNAMRRTLYLIPSRNAPSCFITSHWIFLTMY